ncbi:MAG: pentapeptide repeat-containing protein [Spirulinaceae cyanobacterium]
MMTSWLGQSLLALTPLYLTLPAWAADPAALEQLLTTNQCPGCDLSGADLAGANLFGANLVNANLRGANLAGANLGSATLIDADLTEANLAGAHLYAADLADANLSRANLTNAYLREQKLTAVRLDLAQLRGANLSHANLTGMSLAGADLTGVDFSHAHLSGTADELTSLLGTRFTQGIVNITFCNGFLDDFPFGEFVPASVDEEEDYLSFANFEGADLTGANFESAILIGANLRNANLQDANLQLACLPYAELNGADLSNAQLEGAIVRKAMFARVNLRGASGADLTGAYRSERERDIEVWQEEAIVYLREAIQEQRSNDPFVETLDGLFVEPPEQHGRVYDYTLEIQVGTEEEPAIAVIEAHPQISGLKGYAAVVVQPEEEVSEWSSEGLSLCESEPKIEPPFVTLPIILDEDNAFSCQEGTRELEYFSLF